MEYREVFEIAGLSSGFEFLECANHKVKLECKACGYQFVKGDDFLRKSLRGKVKCKKCGVVVKYFHANRPEAEKLKQVDSEIRELVSQGKSVSEIVSITGMSDSRIRSFLSKNGLKTVRYSRDALLNMAATRAQMREKLTSDWRNRFATLGLDGFEYVSFIGHKSHLIRCKKCGCEFERPLQCLLNGKQKAIRCKYGNGRVVNSAFVDKVMEYYACGHSVTETAQLFGVTRSKVTNWANVQLAHRICNSVKSAKRGEEWNNVNKAS